MNRATKWEHTTNPMLSRAGQKKLYCQPKNDDRWAVIAAHLMQVSSCAANANPCYPSTGDKARFESDFTFAGRSFTRSYHSLRQLSAPNMARGWSHTFQESISTSGSDKVRYVNEKGYIELYSFQSSSSATAAGAISGRVIQRDPNNSSAGWKVFDEYGDVHEFDYRGRLVAIKSGSDSVAASVSLMMEPPQNCFQLQTMRGESFFLITPPNCFRTSIFLTETPLIIHTPTAT